MNVEKLASEFKQSVASQDISKIKRLIKKHPDQKAMLYETFYWAIRNGNTKLISFLLRKGANPNFDSKRPLLTAIENKQTKVVKLLLKKGAIPNVLCAVNAAADGQLAILKLFKSYNLDLSENEHGAFRLACQNGHDKVAKYLLSLGANVDADNGYPLISATDHGHVKVVDLLLKNKASVLVAEPILVSKALMQKNLKLLKVFKKHKLNFSKISPQVLLISVRKEDYPCFAFLIKNKVQVKPHIHSIHAYNDQRDSAVWTLDTYRAFLQKFITEELV